MDNTWGIGISIFNKDVGKADKWIGDNLFGKILMDLQNSLS